MEKTRNVTGGADQAPPVVCNRCGIEKTDAEFPHFKGKRAGRICNRCRLEYVRVKQGEVREFVCEGCGEPFEKRMKKATLKTYVFCSRKCKERAKRWRQHGLTLDEFRALGDSCAICATTENLVVDHDHRTGRVRGLLCGFCNSALGYLRDDPSLCDAAKTYLVHG
jgi:Recombination endonuclease VII